MLGINFLVVNPELILMNKKQLRLQEILKFYGIDVIATDHTYGRHL